MATRITATELSRNLSDILSRVRYRGESFVIERNGEVVAELRAPTPRRSTVKDIADLLEQGPKPDPGFWHDVEEAHKLMNQPLPAPPDWQS